MSFPWNQCKNVNLSAKKCNWVQNGEVKNDFELGQTEGWTKIKKKIETLYLNYLITKQSAKLNNNYLTGKSYM